MSAKTYVVMNGVQPTTAAPVKQPTGTAIRTMLQIAPQISPVQPIRVVEWGISFDAAAAAAAGEVEMFACTGAATMSTPLGVGDVMPYSDENAPANSSGTGGSPLALGTALSGFAAGSVTEGTVGAYRLGDLQLIAPTSQYCKQYPLSREFEMGNKGGTQEFLRIRVTFTATVNLYCYVIFEA